MRTFKKINSFQILALAGALLHFLLSFFYDIKPNSLAENLSRQAFPVQAGERIYYYIATKIFLLFVLILLWQFILWVLTEGRKQKSFFRPFILIFSIFTLICIISFPAMFTYEIDVTQIYTMALRWDPLHWHSYFTSLFYMLFLNLIPHPLGIPILQCLMFSIVFAYIFNQLSIITNKGKLRYLSLVFVLMPDAYYIALLPYRNCFYTIITLALYSFLLFEYINQRQLRWYKIMILSLATGFVAFFRSEGILNLFLLPLFTFLVYKKDINIKKLSILFLAAIFSFAAFSLPAKKADAQYYGDAYALINVNPMLRAIFNSESANLSYENSQQDIENIDALIPREYLQTFGAVGYQMNNLNQGKPGNQSYDSNEDQKKYVQSAFSIMLHNPKIVIKERLDTFFTAIGVNWPFKTPLYQGVVPDTQNITVQPFFRSVQEVSQELKDRSLFGKSNFFQGMQRGYEKINMVYNSIMTPLNVSLHLIALLLLFILAWKNGMKKQWLWLAMATGILAQIAAIALVAPEARSTYYFAVFYLAYLFIVVNTCVEYRSKCFI